MAAEGFGILHLGTTTPDSIAVQTGWTGCTVNAIVLLITLILFTVNFRGLIHLLPEVLNCILRAKPNIGLEHNLHSSAERNATAWIMMPAFAMIADRYHLYNPSFIEWLPYGWSLAATFIVIFIALGSRYIFYPLRPNNLRGDVSKAAHNTLYTCFVGMMLFVIPTACITLAVHTPDAVAKAIILYEIALFFLLSVIRTTQFLSRQCSVFSTFSYLCALELVPAAILIASARLF